MGGSHRGEREARRGGYCVADRVDNDGDLVAITARTYIPNRPPFRSEAIRAERGSADHGKSFTGSAMRGAQIVKLRFKHQNELSRWLPA